MAGSARPAPSVTSTVRSNRSTTPPGYRAAVPDAPIVGRVAAGELLSQRVNTPSKEELDGVLEMTLLGHAASPNPEGASRPGMAGHQGEELFGRELDSRSTTIVPASACMRAHP